MRIEFEAQEYHSDTSVRTALFRFEGDERSGWQVFRNGETCLELGRGFRALDVVSCGVCSTDLARHFLPFPLPQIIGHEVVLKDQDGRRFVTEINASCRARGLDDLCTFCALELETHCPHRVTLGIDRLPGGFGDVVLAPRAGLIELKDSMPTSTAVLVEPFAAALHAVETIKPRAQEKIAVLGPRRLGMLALAALASWRRQQGTEFEILAIVRRDSLKELALKMGADRVEMLETIERPGADVVIDTTGSPSGLIEALGLARREVHLKSTHGLPAGGLKELTALVVDELTIARLPKVVPKNLGLGAPEKPVVAWLSHADPALDSDWENSANIVRGGDPAEMALRLTHGEGGHQLGRADVVVVDNDADIDRVIRPRSDSEESLLRPRGMLFLDPDARSSYEGDLARAVIERDLTISSSRCGDFSRALKLLDLNDSFRGLGETFITHQFARVDLAAAMEMARSPECLKATVGN